MLRGVWGARAMAAGIGITLLAACTPIDLTPTSEATTSTPTSSAGPSASPSTSASGAEWTDWAEGDPIVPGVRVAAPDADELDPRSWLKPDELQGHSVYYDEGYWYVFDPAGELPQRMLELYFGHYPNLFSAAKLATINFATLYNSGLCTGYTTPTPYHGYSGSLSFPGNGPQAPAPWTRGHYEKTSPWVAGPFMDVTGYSRYADNVTGVEYFETRDEAWEAIPGLAKALGCPNTEIPRLDAPETK